MHLIIGLGIKGRIQSPATFSGFEQFRGRVGRSRTFKLVVVQNRVHNENMLVTQYLTQSLRRSIYWSKLPLSNR